MNRLISPVIIAQAPIFGVFPPQESAAQAPANNIVGTWTLVAITLEQDGKKTDFYSPNPQGQVIYDANGHVSVIITRSDIPRFASANRQAGTSEENKAVVQGSIAYFGTYTVDEAAKTLKYHVQSCSFPNWNGIDRNSTFNISGDELIITNPMASTGTGSDQVVWKRAK